jgi:ABC-type methionine transport system permease subunit
VNGWQKAVVMVALVAFAAVVYGQKYGNSASFVALIIALAVMIRG